MRNIYPQCSNFWFRGYPKTIKVVCGPEIVNLDGPWVDGSVIILTQTPLSMTHNGQYFEGGPIPDYKLIYSESGQDDDFKVKFKISGSSELTWRISTTFRVQIYKYFEVISGYNGKHLSFFSHEFLVTTIPITTKINDLWNPNATGDAVWIGGTDVAPIVINPNDIEQLPNTPEQLCKASALQIILTGGYYVGVPYTTPYTLSVSFNELSPAGYTKTVLEERSSYWYFSCGLYYQGKRVLLYKNWTSGGILVFVIEDDLYSFTVTRAFIITSIIYNGVEVIGNLRGII